MGVAVRQTLAWGRARSVNAISRLPLLLATAFISAAVLFTGTPQASANSKYAGIVIDAKTGRTLYELSADAPRYPASLTKMMTLYLVFEALESGKITKQTRVPMTRNGAAEPPTKIGLRPGQTIAVNDAILALVTKSANDVATALGEFLGGSETTFARMMTAKARALGMSNTVFRNANGLPNSQQHTTAHDMARLGIALREHFPQYYGYFSTRVFAYGNRRYGNHNHLLGRVKGMDGIKTGYTRASGFNLVSSVEDNGRSIVAVVMGGRSARSRDAQMVKLINAYLPKASRRGDGDLIAQVPVTKGLVAAIALPKKDAPTPDLRPVKAAPVIAYAAPKEQAAPAAVAKTAALTQTPQNIDPVKTASTRAEVALPSGWVIQVASLESESDAKAFLSRTTAKAAGILAHASPFTETFTKGGTLYYRARYGGFSSKNDAWGACSALKKKSIACYAVMR